MTHVPVLTKEVLEYLNPKPNENVIDATVGQAGHALLILEKIKPEGKLLGIDLDPLQIENSKALTKDIKNRVVLVCDSYTNIKKIVENTRFRPVNAILLDLGYSSWQLEHSSKGFSFNKDEVLDMRYSLQNTLTAEKIVNEYPEGEIAKLLAEYGEEKFAKKIAQKITEQRKVKRIKTTFELKEIILRAIPVRFRNGKIHPATRTFQALRIAVNSELENITKVLPDAVSMLSPGGRLVVISFHSLEDRIVKYFFKKEEQKGIITIVTQKPVIAQKEEVVKNPRARSAKLRALLKI